ncbi:Zinc finger BED domain-containing [Brachionus plicatilis]|uniref:Zinc finger BED domain-containing n=1 Tax=Brachionus plicatilis TaxID=10195 RepID=A0A3M7R7T4_BRAPC|nr:Zinc finger BED domain-containing [Brachionus plicatilis]
MDVQKENPTDECSVFEQEFCYYQTLSFNPKSKDDCNTALEFFQLFKKYLPSITQICEFLFSVTSTSVPAENLFSSAGLVQDELRNKIEPTALEMINFIAKNKYI